MKFVLGRARKREQPGLPFWKQRGWLLSVAFVVFAVLAAALSAVDTSGADEEMSSSDLPGGLVVQTAPSCPSGESTDELPKSPPQDLRWDRVGPARVPASASAGPKVVTASSWSCFAHSPMGAVMAVHAILPRMSGDGWRDVAASQIVPGPGRNAYVAGRSNVSNVETSGRSAATYVGFAVASYTPDAATVRLLIRQPMGSLVTTSVSTRWADGDWKVAPDPDGALYTALSPAMNNNEYTLWRN